MKSRSNRQFPAKQSEEVVMSRDYSSLHTKQLLNLLQSFRKGYSPFEEQINFEVESTAVRAELAKRPHIPNKVESRVIRQAAAKKGR
jgi:hypothetical protein